MRFLLLLVIFSSFVSAQNNKLDSLQKVLLTTDSEDEKADIYTKISYYYLGQDFEIAKLYGDTAFSISKAINDTLRLANSYSLFAQFKLREGQQDSALYYYAKYKNLFDNFESVSFKKEEAFLMGEIGVVYYYKSMYDSALYYFNKSINLNKELQNYNLVARMQSNIGSILYHQEKYAQSLTNFRDAQQIFEGSVKDTMSLINVINNTGLIFYDLKDFTKALTYFNKGIRLATKVNSAINKEMLLLNLGSAYFYLGQFEKALDCYKESLEIKKKNNIPFGINLVRLAGVYLELGLLTKAKQYFELAIIECIKSGDKLFLIDAEMGLADVLIILKEYTNAQNLYLSVLEDIKLYQSNKYLFNIYKKLLKVALHLGEVDTATKYIELFISINDSIIEESINEGVYEIEAKYQVKEKENDIIILQQENTIEARKKKLILIIGSFILFIVLFFFRLKAITLTKSIKILELENLHKNKEILYNSMILSKRNEDANNFYQELDKLNMHLTSENLRTLQRQIKTYVQIEDSWQNYMTSFTKFNPQFNSTLSEMGIELTNSEKRLCALVAQGLTINEIANIISIVPASVGKARIRLRKKLQLDTGIDLKQFLENLGR
jgi:tetratricopeptide (TPR) repeat protein|tara:strand:- start:2455 stop:4281 length:1827 start_codon:yes stop_codon:yes gene_type:complete